MRVSRNASGKPATVLVADSNTMACQLLASGLQRCRCSGEPQLVIAASVIDKSSLILAARNTKPDVALISANLQDGPLTGLAALQELRILQPTIRLVLLKDRVDPHLVVEAFRAGARGVFSRSESELADLCKCVLRVHEGQIWANNRQLEYLLDAVTQIPPLRVVDALGTNLLSKREEDVVRLVAEGLGNREIAQQLNLSEHTVKNYLFHIFDKLGVSNRVELVLYAVANPRKVPPASELLEHTGAASSALDD